VGDWFLQSQKQNKTSKTNQAGGGFSGKGASGAHRIGRLRGVFDPQLLTNLKFVTVLIVLQYFQWFKRLFFIFMAQIYKGG
jgi:hypothetical protein